MNEEKGKSPNNNTNKVAVLDTNFLVALIDEKDSLHKKSLEVKDYLIREDFRQIIFDFIIAEALSVIARRTEERYKKMRGDNTKLKLEFISKTEKLIKEVRKNIIWVSQLIFTKENFKKIYNKMKQSGGKLNFNDCAILLFMEEEKIKYIVSFDRDFDQISSIKRIG